MTNPQPTPKLQWTKGDRLGKALRIADVSHAEMADLLGVSRNTVGNYIADRTPVKDAAIRVWAMRTGISFDEIKYGLATDTDGPGGTEVHPPGLEPGTHWLRDKVTEVPRLRLLDKAA